MLYRKIILEEGPYLFALDSREQICDLWRKTEKSQIYIPETFASIRLVSK